MCTSVAERVNFMTLNQLRCISGAAIWCRMRATSSTAARILKREVIASNTLTWKPSYSSHGRSFPRTLLHSQYTVTVSKCTWYSVVLVCPQTLTEYTTLKKLFKNFKNSGIPLHNHFANVDNCPCAAAACTLIFTPVLQSARATLHRNEHLVSQGLHTLWPMLVISGTARWSVVEILTVSQLSSPAKFVCSIHELLRSKQHPKLLNPNSP